MGLTVTESQIALAKYSRACKEGIGRITAGMPIEEMASEMLAWCESVFPSDEQAEFVTELISTSALACSELAITPLGLLGRSGSGDGSGYGDGSGDGD